MARSRHAQSYLISCSPKSGSTFGAKLLANYLGTDKFFAGKIADRAIQELDADGIEGGLSGGKRVIHQHVPYHAATQAYLDAYGIKPLVLVRNVYDAVPSIRDHLKSVGNGSWPGAHIDRDILSRSDEQIEVAIADLILPWYFTFYVGWKQTSHPIVTYRQVIDDPSVILAALGLDIDGARMQAALLATQAQNTRKNIGVHGRGGTISALARGHIDRLASHYAHVDLSPLLD